jgi:hypothetical protein
MKRIMLILLVAFTAGQVFSVYSRNPMNRPTNQHVEQHATAHRGATGFSGLSSNAAQPQQKSTMQKYQDFYHNPNKTQAQVKGWSNYFNN